MTENLSLKAFVVLMKAAKTLEGKVTDDMGSHDMKVPEFTVLETLFHKGPQTVREISNAVLIKFGSITYVMDKLQKKGLIERINGKEDRRVVYIHLTTEGKDIMETIFPQHQLVIENIFRDMDTDEKELLIGLLKKVGKGV